MDGSHEFSGQLGSAVKRFLNTVGRPFNSVWFGIAMMALVGLYIALGSGFASLREAFEMDELQFFNAWPLKLLMVLLVINLVVVTWRRIPLTPPRYGVWCVHVGIILLIMSTAFYYNHKIEGSVRLYTDASFGAVSADHFYDKDQRSLYVKIDGANWNNYPLPTLPRFKAYDGSLGNADVRAMHGADLTRILPIIDVRDGAEGQTLRRSLSQTMGWKDELTMSVIGYFPYATVDTRFDPSPSGHTAGFRLTLPEMKDGNGFETWLVAEDPRYRFVTLPGTDTEFEHRQAATAADRDSLVASASKLFRLDVIAGAQKQTVFVQPGQTYSLASGYSLAVENYNPAWPMFGTNEIVKAITMTVTSPTQKFRRMVLQGQDVQTDFKLDVPEAGPMGKRQKTPLDGDLNVHFTLADVYGLLPRDGSAKHTLVTTPGSTDAVDVFASLSTASTVKTMSGGAGDIPLSPADPDAAAAPFAKAAAAPAPDHPAFPLHVEYQTNFLRDDSVQVVPPARRVREVGETGAMQILRMRVAMGSWSQDVIVPYAIDAGDQPWDGGRVTLPTGSTLQLQLGQTKLPLPARLTLDKFELVPYPGGDQSERSIKLDYRSTISIEDPNTGERSTAVAHLNNPVYFGSGSWLFFQAAYDGDAHHWTVLGVGNRPGVNVMLCGCVLIVIGLMYAFYAKPVIIRKMKENAIAKAAKRRDELVSV